MKVQAELEERLRRALEPSQLDVVNESSAHNVPAGSESHFKVVVVSGAFEGKSPLERHRLVYAALGDAMRGRVHAVSIVARTRAEWEASSAVAPSPPCLGGSKHG